MKLQVSDHSIPAMKNLTIAVTFVLMAYGAAAGEELVTVSEMQVILQQGMRDTTIVDTRCPDAYMGWALDGVIRGGHLPGSVNFAARWLKVDLPDHVEQLDAVLQVKGITADKRIVLCDSKGTDRKAIATYLSKKGFKDLRFFDLKTWAADTTLPLEVYPNYSQLVPPVIVKALLDGERPESFEDAGPVRFAEVSWGEESKSYLKGHIPTSFHIDTNSVEPPPLWELASPVELQDFVIKHGFTPNDTVILSGADPMASFRLAVVLRYIGVGDVRVLHGGLDAWITAGYPVETKAHKPVPTTEFGTEIPANPELIVSCDVVKKRLTEDPDFTLVDNRTWDEHVGKVTGYSYHKVKGRIPGAIFGYAGRDGASSMEYYRNIDNTMRSADEIQSLWSAAGIDPEKHLSFMCGGGWRAAEVLSYAHVMGLEDISLFSDGWLGWSRDSTNPIATGIPAPATSAECDTNR